MAYATDLTPTSGNPVAEAGNMVSRIGQRIWLAVVTAQERRAQVLLEQYKRDGFIW